MLRADRLTCAAAYTVGCLSAALGMHSVIKLSRPVAPYFSTVHAGENAGDRNIRRTSVYAIFTRGALNKCRIAKDSTNRIDIRKLLGR